MKVAKVNGNMWNLCAKLVQRLPYQANCALFDESTKVGTHVDFHLILDMEALSNIPMVDIATD